MDLVDRLIKDGYLRTPLIISAFRRIKREDFVRVKDRQQAKINYPLSIGYGQTISQPLTVAFMLELLDPRPGGKILDVGSGSGWTVALLAEIAGASGKVYGLEIIKELKKFAEGNVRKYNFINKGMARIYNRDGREGLPEHAPFDRIIISAAADKIPEKLLSDLKTGGTLVAPVGTPAGVQDIVRLVKISENEFQEEKHSGFIFVPLLGGGDE